MNFFILGDSWGVGEWSGDRGMDSHILESVPNTGTGAWLQSYGHHVVNISAGSASNFGQLRKAYWTLEEHHDYDWIIWFYTEPFRDIIETVINDSIDGPKQYPEFTVRDFPRCEYITSQNFSYAQMIYEKFKIPWVVIGGQTSVPESINGYNFAHHVIGNWSGELLDLDFQIPEYTWFSWEKFQTIFDFYGINEQDFVKQEIDVLDKVDIVLAKSRESKYFPDDCHASNLAHAKLTSRILEIVGANEPTDLNITAKI